MHACSQQTLILHTNKAQIEWISSKAGWKSRDKTPLSCAHCSYMNVCETLARETVQLGLEKPLPSPPPPPPLGTDRTLSNILDVTRAQDISNI